MKSLTASIPTFARWFAVVVSIFRLFFRFILSGWLWKRIVFATACVATLIALYFAEERWRWRSAWKQYEKDARSRGTRLHLSDFPQPSIPDDQNFAAIPLFQDFHKVPIPEDGLSGPVLAGLLGFITSERVDDKRPSRLMTIGPDGKIPGAATIVLPPEITKDSKPSPPVIARELLRQLDGECGEVWRQLEVAADRPLASYAAIAPKPHPPMGPNLPFLRVRKATQLAWVQLALHAASRDGAAAFADARIGFGLVQSLKDEGTLLAGMIRTAVAYMVAEQIWGCLAEQLWDDATLARLDEMLSQVDLVAGHQFALETERAFANTMYQRMFQGEAMALDRGRWMPATTNGYPVGWLYRNQLRSNTYTDLQIWHAGKPRRTLGAATEMEAEIAKANRTIDFLFLIWASNYPRAEHRVVLVELTVRQARIACALERYRLRHGNYPERLAELLTEKLLPVIPKDPVSDADMEYARLPDGRFSLVAREAERRVRDTGIAGHGWAGSWIPATLN